MGSTLRLECDCGYGITLDEGYGVGRTVYIVRLCLDCRKHRSVAAFEVKPGCEFAPLEEECPRCGSQQLAPLELAVDEHRFPILPQPNPCPRCEGTMIVSNAGGWL